MKVTKRILRACLPTLAIASVAFGGVFLVGCKDSGDDDDDALIRAWAKEEEGRSDFTASEAKALLEWNKAMGSNNAAATETRAERAEAAAKARAAKAEEQFCENDMAIYNYMRVRWTALSESSSGYVPEMHDDLVAAEAAKRFGVSPKYAGDIYVKIDMASLGVKF